ncbi:MAG TPA: T9SS type A sorting domain-containing protein [Chitinophagales bacterium]|nr:T9SS type A sorting domain-containing protein [Chitinophagales bacterium]
MKKLLLTLSSVLVVAIAFSQQNVSVSNEALKGRLKNFPSQDGTPYANPLMVTHVLPQHQSNGGLRSLTEVKFSSSHNGFMLLVSQSQCLTVNTDLKLINFTQRAPESIVQANGGGTNATGIITNSWSVNDGATWDTDNVVIPVQGASHCRYPSGGIYNPPGNTNPLEAYSVVGGPCTDDVNWIQYYYGSAKLDGSNGDQQFYDNQNGNSFQQMPRLSFTTCGNLAFVLGSTIDFNPTPLFTDFPGAVINRGVFNTVTNKFDWTQIPVHVPLALDQTGTQEFENLGNLAFNDDGSIGYFVILGVDSANPVGYYPIIFRSTDFGLTWVEQSFFDFRNIAVWDSALYLPTHGSTSKKPLFSWTDGIDAVVDNNGLLHLICTIYSASSDDIDSLGYSYTFPKPLIFDVHQVGDVWDAYFIDSVLTLNGTSIIWTSTTAPFTVGVDARIQAATSPDRTKIFTIWADTDPQWGLTTNDLPDLKGMGVDWSSGVPTNTGVINFTANTDYLQVNFWHYVSDRAFDAGGGMFTVPVTISQSRDGQSVMDNVMDHYYVNDVTFPFTVGVPPVNNVSFSVDQNYPNPFSDQTQIKVTLARPSDVNLRITNILGQEVANKNFNFSGGSHNIHLSKSNFSSGVYNFTVTADGKQISKTMIIQ